MATFYGIEAATGFAFAAAKKYGVKITVRAGANSCTDGREITLSVPKNALTLDGFRAWCGVALHEVSHIVYGSAAKHKAYHGGDSHRAACYNACIDVADESRLTAQDDGNPRQFFACSGKEAWETAKAAGVYDDPKTDMVWKILTAAMHYNEGHDSYTWTIKQQQDVQKAFWAVQSELAGCVDRRRAAKPSKRASSTWRDIAKHAEAIATILKPFEDKTKNVPAAGTTAQGEGQPADIPQAGQGQPGQGQPKPGDKMAGMSDGASMAGMSLTPSQGAAAGGGEGGTSTGGSQMSVAVYGAMRNPIRRVVQEMIESEEAPAWDRGFTSGRKLSGLHRAEIDGNIFARKQGEDHGETETAIAIALDCSGSMGEWQRTYCAGAAQAFVDAARSFADVGTWVFGSYVNKVSGFGRTKDMGGTNTCEAMKQMDKWLNSTGAKRKYAVVLTDGQPGNEAEVQRLCRKWVHEGVGVVCMCIGGEYLRNGMLKTMPGAACIASQNAGIMAGRVFSEIRKMRM